MVFLSTTQVCKYLVFCWHPKLMPVQISKLLALMPRCLMPVMHSKMLHHFFLSKITLCNYYMMSFSGHPVCCLGLNWCILLGLFIFLALAKGSCCLLSPLGGKASFIMHSKCQISFAFISNITSVA